MELSDYLPMFLAEGREHLQTLNLSLVKVEREPRDVETINDIFRVAHTLKGMSATMGFSRMASLTHEMENVMEGMKSRADGLGQDALDTLFGCLDTLSKLVDEVEEHGAERSDPGDLVSQLQRLLAVGAAAHGDEAAQSLDDAPTAEVVASVESAGLYVAKIRVTLAEDVDMPGVRGFLAVRKAEEHGELLHCVPDLTVIEAGEVQGREILLWLATADEPAAVADDVAGQEGIGACTADRYAAVPADKASTAAAIVATTSADVVGDVAPAARVAAAPGRHKAQTVRVEAERLDLLMHMMGEMVVQRTRLESIASASLQTELQSAVNDLSRVAQSLQQMVMQVRMVPVESVFMRFPRMVRDIASKLGKQVDLKIQGEDTELDRTVVEALGDPLVHLVRNAMDHGLESPEERVAAGKPATGTITISAEHAGGEVLIRVREDGRGIDPAKVAARGAGSSVTPVRHMVRMAQQVVSSDRDDVLVSLGLGSCIGLAVIDPGAGIAGLAHIVLPKSALETAGTTPAKFADTAVPALVESVVRAGGRSGRLHAVMCGGAHMFGTTGASPVMQIGSRNADATMEALRLQRIPVRGQDTGGSTGRSIEVDVESGVVRVRGIGQQAREL